MLGEGLRHLGGQLHPPPPLFCFSGPQWFPHSGGQMEWGLGAGVVSPVQFASSKLGDWGRSLSLLPTCYNGDNTSPIPRVVIDQ